MANGDRGSGAGQPEQSSHARHNSRPPGWGSLNRVAAGTVPADGSGGVTALSADEQVLRLLHDEHAPALWGYAMRLTGGDTGRAQDAVQETLLRAWKHPEVMDSERGSPRPWLFTTLRNVLIDEWRAARSDRRSSPTRCRR